MIFIISLNAPQREVLTSNNLALPLFSLIFLGEKKIVKIVLLIN